MEHGNKQYAKSDKLKGLQLRLSLLTTYHLPLTTYHLSPTTSIQLLPYRKRRKKQNRAFSLKTPGKRQSSSITSRRYSSSVARSFLAKGQFSTPSRTVTKDFVFNRPVDAQQLSAPGGFFISCTQIRSKTSKKETELVTALLKQEAGRRFGNGERFNREQLKAMARDIGGIGLSQSAADLRVAIRTYIENVAGLGDPTAIDETHLPPLPPPTVPSLSGTSGNEEVDLTWTASTGGAGSISYLITAQSAAGVRSERTAGTSFKIRGLDNGTSYQIAVVAEDADGVQSARSNTLTLTPTATPPPPATPAPAATPASTTPAAAPSPAPTTAPTITDAPRWAKILFVIGVIVLVVGFVLVITGALPVTTNRPLLIVAIVVEATGMVIVGVSYIGGKS